MEGGAGQRLPLAAPQPRPRPLRLPEPRLRFLRRLRRGAALRGRRRAAARAWTSAPPPTFAPPSRHLPASYLADVFQYRGGATRASEMAKGEERAEWQQEASTMLKRRRAREGAGVGVRRRSGLVRHRRDAASRESFLSVQSPNPTARRASISPSDLNTLRLKTSKTLRLETSKTPRAQAEKTEEELRAELKSPFGDELTVGRPRAVLLQPAVCAPRRCAARSSTFACAVAVLEGVPVCVCVCVCVCARARVRVRACVRA
jgi:hypothetical protein